MKSLTEKIYSQVRWQVGRQVRNQVGGPVYVYAWEQVDWQVEGQVGGQVYDQVGGPLRLQVYEKFN